MRILLLSAFAVFVGIISAKESYAQSAYDSACYFPQMGNPDELDTIYGGVANQGLGGNIGHLPPLTGQTYDRLVMQGLPTNIPFLTAVETGPTFNLHSLHIIEKYAGLGYWPTYVYGHFRSPK